mgnify:CR=1 FL=1
MPKAGRAGAAAGRGGSRSKKQEYGNPFFKAKIARPVQSWNNTASLNVSTKNAILINKTDYWTIKEYSSDQIFFPLMKARARK